MPPRRADTEEMRDMDDDHDGSNGSDGGGKGSTQVRKAQNRIAQREFRLRKQQYIRDLEARVEVLSGDKEERVDLMTLLIRNLLKENKDLRDMVKNMASFLGEGLGSCLPRLGLSAPQLDAILNRADTDTAYDAFLALKASREMEAANPGIAIGEPRRRPQRDSVGGKRKHGSMDATSTPTPTPQHDPGSNVSSAPGQGEAESKRHRGEVVSEPLSADLSNYAYLFPDLETFAQNPYAVSQPTEDRGSMFNNAAMGFGSAAYMGHSGLGFASSMGGEYAPQNSSGFGLTIPPSSANYYEQQVGSSGGFGSGSGGGAAGGSSEADRQRKLREAVASITSAEGSRGADGPEMTREELDERKRAQRIIQENMPDSDRRTKAFQLITYHLNNFRVNHSYHLPASLQPTKVQRTIPHEHAIDGIIFPSIRDRMILLRGRYDLVEVFHGLLSEFRLLGEDPLDHHGWEVSEKWLSENKLLVDDEVYAITNRWRSARGEQPLTRTSS